MAYAAIISLKQTLQEILVLPHRYSIPCDHKHIESFHEKIEFLQHFLEVNPSHESNEKVTSLERRIRDAAYEAEDFMDLHVKNILDSKSLRLLAAFQNDTSLCFKLIAKVDSIIREVIKIKEQIEIKQGRGSFIGEFGKLEDFQPRNAFRKDPSQLVSSDKKNLMVGFDDHLMQIMDQLTGQSFAREVISIVGMGGIGKTTLATNVYNDPYVVNHFDIRAWATVSQSYGVRDLLLGMLDSMKILTKEMYRESDDKLALHVYQNLKGRRYLITIDDIWDNSAWDCLKMMFPDDETGSRIMLTTRIADVVAYVSPSGTSRQISLLSDDQSWKLLCSKVFGDEPCPLNLQEIGKTIAENCQGLPLSIVVISGLLSKVKNTQVEWQSVADNVTSLVFSSDDRCSDILRLSYNYLPQYLKACFLYMCVFPKNYEIYVSKVIRLWIAEGFLRQAHGQSPEEVAERCVEDLLDRSLILMSKKKYKGKIKAFKVHDLLLDFCVKEAKDEKFLQITQSPTNLFQSTSASERRISILRVEKFEHSQSHFDSMSFISYVRSLVFLKRCSISSNLFLAFKLLRVLDATDVRFLKFPPQVLELLNLRYLALLYHGNIPALIIKLWNLQTLIIYGNSKYDVESFLPEEIWMMVHLRHVRFEGGIRRRAAALVLYKNRLVLKDLKTLSGLINLRFSKEILQSIPNIEEIDVTYDAVGLLGKGWSYYEMENLGNLHHLKTLKISDLYRSLKLIPTSQFPPSLITLTLDGVGILWHDLSIIGSLPNLEVLKLKDHACQGTEWEPNEDEFCKLKVLVLEILDLKHWKADSNHFPSLERLIIRYCSELVEIPSGMGEIPTLTTIGLYECNANVLASANEILEKQLSDGNDGFQVIQADVKQRKQITRKIDLQLGPENLSRFSHFKRRCFVARETYAKLGRIEMCRRE